MKIDGIRKPPDSDIINLKVEMLNICRIKGFSYFPL